MVEPLDTSTDLTVMRERVSLLEHKLRVIQDVAAALGSTLDLEQLLRTIMRETMRILDADRATLYLADEDRGELWSKITQGGDIREIRLRIPEGIAGWVAQSGETVNIPDAYEDQRFNREVDRSSGYRTRSMLTMPMLNSHGKVIGVVQVLNKSGERPFDREDEELLRALAAQAAMSIENGKLYQSLVQQNAQLLQTQQKLEQRMYELDLLYQIEQETLRVDSPEELLDRMAILAQELVSAQASSVVMLCEDRATLQFSACSGPRGQALRKARMPRGSGIAGWVIDHGEPLIVRDVAADPRHNQELARQSGYFPRAILCVPIRGEGEVLGALELLDKSGTLASFDENDLKLASLIAGHLAKSIQLARSREERLKEGRLASIGQMLSSVLHDLKTPMTIASGYAQLLQSVSSPGRRDAYVAQLLKQFQVMDAMTRELLAFARGESQVLIRKVYLHRFWPEIEEHLTQEFTGKGIQVVMDVRFNGAAFFDDLKLRRVIHNFATNAARAMPDGGTFTVSCESAGEQLVLGFADTGSGIPEEMEGRLFTAFATGDARTGTGLGLAIVKKIVSDHRGEISYQTERGQGTRFVVTLPNSRDAYGTESEAIVFAHDDE
jgi:signal transduction histidine kinase